MNSLLCLALLVSAATAQTPYAEIRVVDAQTGRGVPLVELETTNHLLFVTDNAGRVAFHEPGLMDRQIFFFVRSHGYEVEKDGFGIAGVRITPRVGTIATIKVKRRNIAERLCRLTGEGLYRDSVLLGRKVPFPDRRNEGNVAGQDSIQATIHAGKVYCFWGDTNRMEYPLGLFRMAGATMPIPDPSKPESDPAAGIPYEYFVDKTGFARAMMPLPERPEGVVWIFGVFVAPDKNGTPRMVGHYSRRKGLAEELEQGIAVFNDEKQIFESAKLLPKGETWRFPKGHPIRWKGDGKDWILFGSPNPNVRVLATLDAALDPMQYEAFTCAKAGEPVLDEQGQPQWRWQREVAPVDSATERRWRKAGKIKADVTRFLPSDAAGKEDAILLHSGSVRWNEHRKRWILLACQKEGKTSFLGEVWYAEAKHPTGPFTKAVKVATHDKQTFYNVCHHDFLDRDDGRTIHFEGTYTSDFSNNPHRTPRYNYNQVLYRLDLDHPALRE
ncbi:MAG: hypothetical protein K2X38_07545 [Gemmataceae bacterium]|nr:hypothetical protein [Gemmataceae bacterium]